MPRARLFLDANVLFSAAWRDGAGVADLWKLRQVELLSSAWPVAEARRNLDEPSALARLDRLLARVRLVPDLVGDAPEAGMLPAKDRPVLLAAVHGGATHLVTGDHRHFGRWFGKQLLGVRVVTPRLALDELA